jgi:hypothetical protein
MPVKDIIFRKSRRSTFFEEFFFAFIFCCILNCDQVTTNLCHEDSEKNLIKVVVYVIVISEIFSVKLMPCIASSRSTGS